MRGSTNTSNFLMADINSSSAAAMDDANMSSQAQIASVNHASPLRAGLEKMKQSIEEGRKRDDRFGFLALRDDDMDLSYQLQVSATSISASQNINNAILHAEVEDNTQNNHIHSHSSRANRNLPSVKADDSILVPAEGSALMADSSASGYQSHQGDMDVNQQSRMALRTASVITNKYNEGSIMGGGGNGKTCSIAAATNLPSNNGKKVQQTKSFFFWSKVNSIKRRFVSTLIRSVSSARFRHLTSNHFRIINDPAADYGYFLYENHLIFAETSTLGKKLLYKMKNTKMAAKLALIFRGEFVFSQESISRLIWDTFLVMFTFFLIITIPLQHIFEVSDIRDSFVQFINSKITLWILAAEIIANLNTAIYVDGVVTSNRRKIFQHYFWNFLQPLIHSLMWRVDLKQLNDYLASLLVKKRKDVVILGVFYLGNSSDVDDGSRKLNFIVLLKYLDVPARLEDVEGKLQVSSTKSDWLKLIKFECVVLLIAHVTCCLFLLLGLSSTSESDPSISWIEKYSFQSTPLLEKYAISFYYIIITMTTVGYEEKLFIIVVALLSTNVFAYTFSQISEIMKKEELRKRSYNQLMQGVNSEMSKRGFNSLLQHKVRKYYEHRQSQYEQKQLQRQSLFEELPQTLKEEVLQQINGTVIEEIALLRRFSLECKREIALAIKQKVFFPEETIFIENECNEAIFYVAFGAVTLSLRVSTKLHKTKSLPHLNIKTLPKKSVLGYESFLLKGRNPYSARAEGVTVLQFLEQKDLLSILANFPTDYEIYSMIRDEALLNNRTQKLNMRCYACSDYEHSIFQCSLVNPIFRRVNPLKENQSAALTGGGNRDGSGTCYQPRGIFKRKLENHSTKTIANLAEIQTRAKEVIFQLEKEQIFDELCSIFDESEFQDEINENMYFEEQKHSQRPQQQQQHQMAVQDNQNKYFVNIHDVNRAEVISEQSAEEGSDFDQYQQPSNLDNAPSFRGSIAGPSLELESPQLRFQKQQPQQPIVQSFNVLTTARTSPKASENQQPGTIEEEQKPDRLQQYPQQQPQRQQHQTSGMISKRLGSSNNLLNANNNNNNNNTSNMLYGKGFAEIRLDAMNDVRLEESLSPQLIVGGSSKNIRNSVYTPDRYGIPQQGSSSLSINFNDAASQNSVITKSKKGVANASSQSSTIQRGEFPILGQLGSTLRVNNGGGDSNNNQSAGINQLLDQVFVRRAARAQRTFIQERKAMNELQSRESILSRFSMFPIEDQKQLALINSGKIQQQQQQQQLLYLNDEENLMQQELNYFENVSKNPSIIVVEPVVGIDDALQTMERTKSARTVTAGPVLMQTLQKQFSSFAVPEKRYSLREYTLDKGGVFGSGLAVAAATGMSIGNGVGAAGVLAPSTTGLPGTGSIGGSTAQSIGLAREWKNQSSSSIGKHSGLVSRGDSMRTTTSIMPHQALPLVLQHGQSIRQPQQIQHLQQQRQQQLVKWNTTNTNQVDSHSVEYKIRCKEELLDLDLLIIRKNMRLLQDRGDVENYIIVPDNELDIDTVKEWQIYFKRYNVGFVLHRLRKMHEDFIGIKNVKSSVAVNKQRRQQQQTQSQKITDSVTSIAMSRSIANFEKKR